MQSELQSAEFRALPAPPAVHVLPSITHCWFYLMTGSLYWLASGWHDVRDLSGYT
jgi:hypothetical protein